PQEVIPNYYPPVIGLDVYQEAHNAIAQRKGKPGETGPMVNLFVHLVKCAACGGSLVRVNRGTPKRAMMVCDSDRRGLKECPSKPWAYSEVESSILREITELNLDELIKGSSAGTRAYELQRQLLVTEQQLADYDSRIAAIVEAIESTSTGIPVLAERLQALTSEKDNANAAYVNLLSTYKDEISYIPVLQKTQTEITTLYTEGLTQEARYRIRTKLRTLIDRVDIWLAIRKIIITYRIGAGEEGKTIVRFKSGKSFTLPGDIAYDD
ncbi:MAG: recombinase zinc beta ribbon domain-containing protein, partial [Pyrinomonadaceae bacterium]